MRVELRAQGRIDLDGTHRAIVESEYAALSDLEARLGDGPVYLRLGPPAGACGCVLAEIRYSRDNVIYVDRYKLSSMGVRDGEMLQVEEVELAEARSVELQVPARFGERDLARFIGKPVRAGEQTAAFTFSGQPRLVRVAETAPGDIVVIGAQTAMTTSVREQGAELVPVTYKDIGGMCRELRAVREGVEYPLRFPQVFEHLGMRPARGIILSGPPGTGKTLICRALAHETGAAFFSISGPELYSKYYGETEARLRQIFEEAAGRTPAVLLIDELDSLAPRRSDRHGEMESRIVATLCTLMDGVASRDGVAVVATTNRPDAIDPALRREGRFGQEIRVGVPDATGRREILLVHTRRMPLADDVDLAAVAERAVGFVGADLAALCREAAYAALRRSVSMDELENAAPFGDGDIVVRQADFEGVLPGISPSALREYAVEIPRTTWDEIGGLDEVKSLLVENVAYAISRREAFKAAGVQPAKGILLYGPPGSGKTLLARALAHECGANFIAVRGPELRARWFGESEQRIRDLFARARQVAPCVIFFDELDAVAAARDPDTSIGHATGETIVNQILSEMDGIEKTEGVFVVGATNRPKVIDTALLRPGRFDFQVEVPLPDEDGRRAIFGIHLRGKPLDGDVDRDDLVALSKGFSGADIAGVCREAAMSALRDAGFQPGSVRLSMAHLRASMENRRDNMAKVGGGRIGFARGRQ